MNNWISVEDRLPDYDVDVLATDGKIVFVALRYISHNEKEKFDVSYDAVFGYDLEPEHELITHWQPLPPPPEKD